MASTLDGITVLDLSTGAPAALATMFLSDHGARVIRIVHPDDKKMRTGGFIVWDHNDVFDQFFSEAAPLVQSNQITYRESITDGIENAPQAFLDLLDGKNFGKQLVKVS